MTDPSRRASPAGLRKTGVRLKAWFDQLNAWQPAPPRLDQIWKVVAAIAGPFVAIYLAYFAQGAYDARLEDGIRLPVDWFSSESEINVLLAGGGIFVVAMLLWAFTTPRRATDAPTAESEPALVPSAPGGTEPVTDHAVSDTTPKRPQTMIPRAALICSAFAIFLFALAGENVLVCVLWMAGILIFVVSLWSWYGTRAAPHAETSPPFRKINVAILLVILAAGFWLRFYHLASIPENLHFDMAACGLQARDYLMGKEQHIFGKSSYDSLFGIPLMMFLPYAASMKLFGDNIFGLQLASVIAGTISLVGAYLLVWRSFDRHRLAALATAITAFNLAHIHLSRTVLYIEPTLFMWLGLFLFVDGLRARRPLSLALAGILVGFGLQSYYAARIILPIMLVFLVYTYVSRRRWVTENWSGLVLLVLGVLIAIGPNLVYFATDADVTLKRTWDVSLFNPGVMKHLKEGMYAPGSSLDVVIEQIKRSVGMFNYYGDDSVQYHVPRRLLSSLISPLFVLGLGVGLLRWRTPGMILALSSLGLTLVFGSVLSAGAPAWTRIVDIVLFAALFAALPLDQLWDILERVRGQTLAPILAIGIAVFLMIVGWKDWAFYYQWAGHNGHPMTLVGRYLGTLPSQVAACRFSDTYYSLQGAETRFLAGPRQLIDLQPDASAADLDTCPGPPLVWILSPNHLNWLDALRARWPDGIVQENRAPDNSLLFTTYRVFEGHGGQSGQSSSGYLDPAFIGVSLVMAVLSDLGLMFLARRYWQKRGVGRKGSQVVRVFGQFSPVLTWLKYGRLK